LSQIIPVHLDKTEIEEFYNGCCNGTFWPLFHSMPDRANFVSRDWKVMIYRHNWVCTSTDGNLISFFLLCITLDVLQSKRQVCWLHAGRPAGCYKNPRRLWRLPHGPPGLDSWLSVTDDRDQNPSGVRSRKPQV